MKGEESVAAVPKAGRVKPNEQKSGHNSRRDRFNNRCVEEKVRGRTKAIDGRNGREDADNISSDKNIKRILTVIL